MKIKKFDKNFTYIKRWVPEYETENYVSTMIDHKIARERCLEVYKKFSTNEKRTISFTKSIV